jgi:hypothetical protein
MIIHTDRYSIHPHFPIDTKASNFGRYSQVTHKTPYILSLEIRCFQ